jgi:uncharacterized membrane protein
MDKLLILIAWLGWGSWHLFCKAAVQRISPIAMQFIFACCAVPALIGYYCYMQHKGISISISKDYVGVGLAICAFIVTGAATVAYSLCLTLRPVSDIVVVTASYPILVCVLAVPIFGETFTYQKFVGILLVWLGIVVLSR